MNEQLEKVKGNHLAVYIDVMVNEHIPGGLGCALHGYLVTDEHSKKGYGLKDILPSRHGYMKGPKEDLKVVTEVYDEMHALAVRQSLHSAPTGYIYLATHVLEWALSDEFESVFIGLARPSMVSALQTGFASMAASDFKDKKGNAWANESQGREYHRLFNELAERGVPVTVEEVDVSNLGYVRAHELSEQALSHCPTGVDLESSTITAQVFDSVSSAQGYWSYDHRRHPLLSHPRLIFISGRGQSGLGPYLCTMDYEKKGADKKDSSKLEIEVGQSLAHCRYAVVKPHHIDDKLLDLVEHHRSKHRLPHNNLAVLYLSALYSNKGGALMDRLGPKVLSTKTHLTELMGPAATMFTHDMPIPRKSPRAAETFAWMTDVLKAFEETYYSSPGLEEYQFDIPVGLFFAKDITPDLVTETEVKEKVVHKANKNIENPNIVTTVKAWAMEDDVRVDFDVKLSIGYDMPTRNTIAALAGDGFRAFVLVRKNTEHSYQQSVVIMSDKGNGIWATPFAVGTIVIRK